MKVAVTPRVRREAEKSFSRDDAVLACTELDDTDLPNISNNGERVHLAILHLAAGDPAAFRRHLAIARTDWRDVLAVTGF